MAKKVHPLLSEIMNNIASFGRKTTEQLEIKQMSRRFKEHFQGLRARFGSQSKRREFGRPGDFKQRKDDRSIPLIPLGVILLISSIFLPPLLQAVLGGNNSPHVTTTKKIVDLKQVDVIKDIPKLPSLDTKPQDPLEDLEEDIVDGSKEEVIAEYLTKKEDDINKDDTDVDIEVQTEYHVIDATREYVQNERYTNDVEDYSNEENNVENPLVSSSTPVFNQDLDLKALNIEGMDVNKLHKDIKCTELGVEYQGDESSWTFLKVETFNTCLSLCMNSPGCYYWSWTADGICNRFREDVVKIIKKGSVSGASTCPNLSINDKVPRDTIVAMLTKSQNTKLEEEEYELETEKEVEDGPQEIEKIADKDEQLKEEELDEIVKTVIDKEELEGEIEEINETAIEEEIIREGLEEIEEEEVKETATEKEEIKETAIEEDYPEEQVKNLIQEEELEGGIEDIKDTTIEEEKLGEIEEIKETKIKVDKLEGEIEDLKETVFVEEYLEGEIEEIKETVIPEDLGVKLEQIENTVIEKEEIEGEMEETLIEELKDIVKTVIEESELEVFEETVIEDEELVIEEIEKVLEEQTQLLDDTTDIGIKSQDKNKLINEEGVILDDFDKVDQTFNKVNKKFNKVNKKFNKLDQKFNKVNKKKDSTGLERKEYITIGMKDNDSEIEELENEEEIVLKEEREDDNANVSQEESVELKDAGEWVWVEDIAVN